MATNDIVPLCRHVKTDGRQCASPAISGEIYCFFHHRLLARHADFRYTRESGSHLMHTQSITLTAIEGPHSIQLALSVVLNALATGKLETRRATALLYGLQLASKNAGRLLTPPPSKVVLNVESTPDGLDIAQPGATVDLTPSPILSLIENLKNLRVEVEDEEEEEEEEESQPSKQAC